MKKICCCLLACFLVSGLVAQEEKPFQLDYTIPSEAFGDDRKITVYLPPHYYRSTEEKYTVTYVLDGHHAPFVDMGVKVIEYGTYNYKYTPTIVVGIHAKARGWEFSMPVPGDKDDEEYEGGRAPELRQHLKEEVIPFVENLDLPLLPFRTLVGHSSGGLFVLNTLFSEGKDYFDAYIAISPAFRPGENRVLEDATEILKKGEAIPKFVYCSAGTVGEREELFGGAVNSLDSLFQLYSPPSLIWKKSIFESTGHWTCVAPSFDIGMLELTRAFRVDEKMVFDYALHPNKTIGEQMDAFYASRENYGFVEIPKAGYLNRISWEFIGKKQFSKAHELLSWALQKHPDHYRLNKTHARVLVELGNQKEGVAAIKRCLDILEKTKADISAERYEREKTYLQEKQLALNQK